jgi:integrase
MVAQMVASEARRAKLTNAVVASIPVPPAKEGKPDQTIIWDTVVSGFCVRVRTGGSRIFAIKYRVGGMQRWYTIGRFGALTVDQARSRARQIIGRVEAGHDPAAEQRAAKRQNGKPEPVEQGDMTLEAFYAKWRAEHAEIHMVAPENDDKVFKKLRPRFGDKRLSQITRAEVAQMHRDLVATPVAANQCVQRLHAWLNVAIDWDVLPETHRNPATYCAAGSKKRKAIRLYPEKGREVALHGAQLAKLGAGVAHEANSQGHICKRGVGPTRKAQGLALKLLAVTGMRKGEVATLRRDAVDLERDQIVLTKHKTVAHHGTKRVLIGAAAKLILSEALAAFDDPVYVFPGRRSGTHITGINRLWNAIRCEIEADIKAQTGEKVRVTIHDLRHTYMTLGVETGGNILQLGKSIGQSQIATMTRYNNQRDAAVAREADRTGRLIAEGLGIEVPELPEAQIVPLARKTA